MDAKLLTTVLFWGCNNLHDASAPGNKRPRHISPHRVPGGAAMARVSCYYRYATGEQIGVTVEGATSYPDALRELVATAKAMFADALSIAGDGETE